MRTYLVVCIHQGLVESIRLSTNHRRARSFAVRAAEVYNDPGECTVQLMAVEAFWPGRDGDAKSIEVLV